MTTQNTSAARDISEWGFKPGSSFDKYGVKYSRNRKAVIRAPREITHYEIAPGTEKIARYAFAVQSLVEISIPESVTEIEEGAFEDTGITQIKIPPKLTKIPASFCNNCFSLTDVYIPHGITEIGANAFQSCTSLCNVVIPASVQTIKKWAFYYCDALSAVDIPKGCRFSKCSFDEDCKIMSPKEGFRFRSRLAMERYASDDVGVIGWNPKDDFLFRVRHVLDSFTDKEVTAVG